VSASGSVQRPEAEGRAKGAADAILVAERLVVRAGNRTLIGPVDFRIGAGERIGILGHSGSGKSQLLDRLMGLTPLGREEGRLSTRFAGAVGHIGEDRKSSEGGSDAERFPVAAVFQTNALFDILTVRENIAVGAGEGDGGNRSTDAEVDAAIRAVGLDPDQDGDKFPSELSGGMQRRVAVARALRARPALLVLDEPLAGLDGESRRIVQQTVEEAHRDSRESMSVLVVTHDYDFAASFCDRMVWIEPETRALIELEEWREASKSRRTELIGKRLREGENSGQTPSENGGADVAPIPPAPGRGIVARVFREQVAHGREGLQAAARAVGEIPGILGGFLHGPGSGARPGRDIVEIWLRACVLAVPYVALLFALVGLLMVFQSERLLAPIGLASRIPEAVTVGIVQGFGPLLLVLIMAGRTGSAMAADLGGQRLSRQVEMWRLLGRDPRSVLFAPRGWALIVAFPLLLLLSEFVALGAGWLFYSVAPQTGLTARAFWEGVKEAWELGPTLGGMVRTALDGAVLAVIAYLYGTSPKRGAEDVAEASTRTVVTASLAFLVIEVVWTALLGGVE